MKKSYLTIAAMAACVSFASCSNEEIQSVDNHGSVLAVNKVGLEGVNSRAGITAVAFTNGESLGLSIYRAYDGTTTVPTYTAYNDYETLPAANVKYTQSAAGWTATQPIVLSTVVGTVYAYYPYREYTALETFTPSALPLFVNSAQGTGQSDGTVDADQTDYMWATPVEGLSNKVATVDLEMNHALAMVTFKFQQSQDGGDAYPGKGLVSKIVLANTDASTKKYIMAGNATMNLADGKITLAQDAVNTGITLTPAATEDSHSLMDVTDEAKLPRLLLYPVAEFGAQDVMVTITLDGNDYKLNLPARTAGYKAGENYQYTFTMKGTELVLANVAIKPWTAIEANDGDLNLDDESLIKQ